MSGGAPTGASAEGVGTWWQMPQGGLDEGEEPEAAARRELAEETGVTSARFVARTRDWLTYDLPDELVGIAWEGRYRGQKQMWFAARFEGPRERDRPRPARRARAGVRRLAVGDARELPALVVPFKRKVYLSVIEEFGAVARSG